MGNRYLTLPRNSRFHELKLRILADNTAAGSSCSISKAEVVKTGEIVALKQSRTPLSDDASKALAGAAYIPRTLYREERAPYLIVEEWIEGETLFELADNNGMQNYSFTDIATKIFVALCDMYYKRRVYHGDLTPNNVILHGNRTDYELFFIDFDPWYLVDEYGYVRASNISGSMPFLPPEYIFGNLTFDANKALTYCAGAVLYYVRYGYPPYCEQFDRDTTRRLMLGPQTANMIASNKIQRTDFQNWKSHLENLNPDSLKAHSDSFSKVLKMMLSFNPHSRPSLKSAVSLLTSGCMN